MCRVNGSGFRFEENPVEVYPLGWLQLSAVGAACSSAAVALLSSQLLPLYLFLASLFFAPARQSHHFVAIFLCSFSSFSFLSIVRNSISNEEKIISSHVLLISLNLDLEIVDENFVPAAVERSPFRRGANLFGFDINRTRGEKMDRYLGPLGGPGVNLSPLAAHK